MEAISFVADLLPLIESRENKAIASIWHSTYRKISHVPWNHQLYPWIKKGFGGKASSAGGSDVPELVSLFAGATPLISPDL